MANTRKKFITVNGKKYPVKEFSFNTICDLEDMGVSLDTMENKPMSMIRSYVAICMNGDLESAGKEVEQHLINGGNFDDVFSVIGYEMENSDFFRNLKQTEE